MAERWALGLAWALMPSRIAGVPNLLRLCLREFLAPDYALPDPERALAQPPGLAGIVHDLTLPTLLAAYRRGLYPFAHVGPLKWWSPPRRSVLFFKELHIANSLRRLMRQGGYTVTFDRDFEGVIAACAGHRAGRWHLTWITPRIMRAYAEAVRRRPRAFLRGLERARRTGRRRLRRGDRRELHERESQFSREPNTSKIGITVLNWHLAHWGYCLQRRQADGADLPRHGLPRHPARANFSRA